MVRVFNASTTTNVRINQSVPGLDGCLQLDFVAVNESCKMVAITDITMPFENRYAAFQDTREENEICHPWGSTTVGRDIMYSSMTSSSVHLVDATQPIRVKITTSTGTQLLLTSDETDGFEFYLLEPQHLHRASVGLFKLSFLVS
jgi:hypothetical protein